MNIFYFRSGETMWVKSVSLFKVSYQKNKYHSIMMQRYKIHSLYVYNQASWLTQ
jgi:hypothetical protein